MSEVERQVGLLEKSMHNNHFIPEYKMFCKLCEVREEFMYIFGPDVGVNPYPEDVLYLTFLDENSPNKYTSVEVKVIGHEPTPRSLTAWSSKLVVKKPTNIDLRNAYVEDQLVVYKFK